MISWSSDGDLAEEVDVAAVDQEVEPAVAVPVGQAELAAAALAGAAGVEPERAAVLAFDVVVGVERRGLDAEHAPAGTEAEPPPPWSTRSKRAR